MAEPVRERTFKGNLKMPAPIVIAIMIAIFCIVKFVDDRRVLLATLGIVGGGTLFFAVEDAVGGAYGGLLGVGGFVAVVLGGFVYSRWLKGRSANTGR